MSVTHLALVGATASGKTGLAIAAAEELGDVEIVSVDSMQVYQGMDIGTAKPTPAERARIAHHLVDCASPWEDWTVVRFRDAVREAVAAIEARGRRALLVGGSGLYFRAVIDPLEIPGNNPELREFLMHQAESPGGLAALCAELQTVDPVAARRIEPGNRRRIVRAVEVIRSTGRPFSSFGPGLTEYGDTVFPVMVVGIRLPRPILRQRIADRLGTMRAAGFVDEVRRLLGHRRGLSRTARQAIGYAELIDHLERRCSLDAAFATAERRTRRFARRQLKWFERDPRTLWVDRVSCGNANPDDALPALLESWSRCPTSA